MDRGMDVELGVDLDQYLHGGPHCLAHRRDPVLGQLRLLRCDRVVVVLSERVELHGRIAHLHHA